MVTVSDEWIAISILRCIELEKAVVEGAGAAGVAAVLAGLCPDLKGKKYVITYLKLLMIYCYIKIRIDRVVIAICGGNIDTTILGRCLDRGLAADGRLVKFSVTVTDRPGGIAELAKHLYKVGASIKDIIHERAWLKNDIFSVEVTSIAICIQGWVLIPNLSQVVCVVETRDAEHAAEMVKMLRENYAQVTFTGIGGGLGIDIGHESEDEGSEDEFSSLADSGIGHSLLVPNMRRASRSASEKRRLSVTTYN